MTRKNIILSKIISKIFCVYFRTVKRSLNAWRKGGNPCPEMTSQQGNKMAAPSPPRALRPSETRGLVWAGAGIRAIAPAWNRTPRSNSVAAQSECSVRWKNWPMALAAKKLRASAVVRKSQKRAEAGGGGGRSCFSPWKKDRTEVIVAIRIQLIIWRQNYGKLLRWKTIY